MGFHFIGLLVCSLLLDRPTALWAYHSVKPSCTCITHSSVGLHVCVSLGRLRTFQEARCSVSPVPW